MQIRLLVFFICIPFVFFAQTTEDEAIILSKVVANEKGISPIWPGCGKSKRISVYQCFDQKLRDHILKTYQYPEIAWSDKLSGTVTVEFIINKKGKVQILEVNNGHRYLQREAIRIIRSIPKMKPGKWGRKPVAIAYTVPITFIKPKF